MTVLGAKAVLTAILGLGLTGCAAPATLTIASYAADGSAALATGRTLTDHGISGVAGQDCIMFRVMSGDPICRDWEPAPAEVIPVSSVDVGVDAGAAVIVPAAAPAIVGTDPRVGAPEPVAVGPVAPGLATEPAPPLEDSALLFARSPEPAPPAAWRIPADP